MLFSLFSIVTSSDCSFSDSYPQQYVVHKTAEVPVMDGSLDDTLWKEVPFTNVRVLSFIKISFFKNSITALLASLHTNLHCSCCTTCIARLTAYKPPLLLHNLRCRFLLTLRTQSSLDSRPKQSSGKASFSSIARCVCGCVK